MSENSSINLGDIALKVAVAESTNQESDLEYARSLVDELPDGMDKDLLSAKLDAVQEEVDIKRAKESVLKVESTLVHIDFARASKLVDNLPSSESKLNLAHRLDIIREGIDTASIVLTMTETAESTCNQGDLDKARGMLVEMAECSEKSDFETRLDKLQEKINLNEVVNSVDEVELKATEENIAKARTLIEALPSTNDSEELTERLNVVIARNALKIVTERTGLDTISKAGSLIDELKDSSEKRELRTKLDEIVKEINDTITNEGFINISDESSKHDASSINESSTDVSDTISEETLTGDAQSEISEDNSCTEEDTSDDAIEESNSAIVPSSSEEQPTQSSVSPTETEVEVSSPNRVLSEEKHTILEPIEEEGETPTGEIVIDSKSTTIPTAKVSDSIIEKMVEYKAPPQIGVRLRNGNNHIYANVSESSLVDTSIIPILNLDNSATIKPTKCYTWQAVNEGVIVNGGSFTIGYDKDRNPVGILITCAYPLDEGIDLDIRLPLDWNYSSDLYTRDNISGKYIQSLGTVIVENNTISFHGTRVTSYLVINNLADKSNLEELDLSTSFASVSWKQGNVENVSQVIKGATTTGWLCVDTKWYYLVRNGRNKLECLVSSWVEEGGQKFYLQKDGVRATGWLKIEEDWYFFNEDGSMIADEEMNGFKLDKDGKLV